MNDKALADLLADLDRTLAQLPDPRLMARSIMEHTERLAPRSIDQAFASSSLRRLGWSPACQPE